MVKVRRIVSPYTGAIMLYIDDCGRGLVDGVLVGRLVVGLGCRMALIKSHFGCRLMVTLLACGVLISLSCRL